LYGRPNIEPTDGSVFINVSSSDTKVSVQKRIKEEERKSCIRRRAR